MAKLKLNIAERVALLNVLPLRGSVITLRILQELRTSLAFTEEEMAKWRISNKRTPDGGVFITWDEDFANETKDIKVGKVAAGIIKQELVKRSQQGTLHMSELPIYERFVEGKKP